MPRWIELEIGSWGAAILQPDPVDETSWSAIKALY
jgi:hypothetical protein